MEGMCLAIAKDAELEKTKISSLLKMHEPVFTLKSKS